MRTNKSGFTLIEIMLVVIIIGILAAMVIPNLSGRSDQAKVSTVKADIEANISAALDMYEIDNGSYPTTEQGLSALFNKPSSAPIPENWRGPYIKRKKSFTDPWGKPYNYVAPGTHNTESYDLSSYGPDGVSSSDDITNWEENASR